MIAFDVREGNAKDAAFLFATWLKCFQKSYFAMKIDRNVFFRHHHSVIERILARKGCQVLIATPEGDSLTILGYLVIERDEQGTAIHFAYTKRPFRRLGVMRKLIAAAGIVPDESRFTHWTKDTDTLKAKWPGLVYVPYVALTTGRTHESEENKAKRTD